jgi:hypothetical protein
VTGPVAEAGVVESDADVARRGCGVDRVAHRYREISDRQEPIGRGELRGDPRRCLGGGRHHLKGAEGDERQDGQHETRKRVGAHGRDGDGKNPTTVAPMKKVEMALMAPAVHERRQARRARASSVLITRLR